MDVVKRFHSKVGKRYFLSPHQSCKYLGIEVRSRVEWHPPTPDEMPGMQDGDWKSVLTCLCQQIMLNRQLASAVIADRLPSLLFRCWPFNAGAVDPDRAAVEKLLHVAL